MLIVVKEKYVDESNDALDPCPKNEVLDMGQAFQWGGKKPKASNIVKENISLAPTSTFPYIQYPFKNDAMREDMLLRPPISASIVLKDSSLAHSSYVEQYCIDEVLKYNFERLSHGLQLKRLDLQGNPLYHLGKLCIPTLDKLHVTREAYTSHVFWHCGVESIVVHLSRMKIMNVNGCVMFLCKLTNRKLGLHTPFPISSHPRDNISMDFVKGLTMSKVVHFI